MKKDDLIPCHSVHDLSRIEKGDRIYLLEVSENKDWSIHERLVKKVEIAEEGDLKGNVLLKLSDGTLLPPYLVWPKFEPLMAALIDMESVGKIIKRK